MYSCTGTPLCTSIPHESINGQCVCHICRSINPVIHNMVCLQKSLFDRALLQKRSIILRSLLIVATPCAKEPYQRDFTLQKRPTILRSLLIVYCNHMGNIDDETHYCVSKDWCIAMGWLRLVSSLNLKVSFVEYSVFYRALLQKSLQKRRVILRSLLIVATAYIWQTETQLKDPSLDAISVCLSVIYTNIVYKNIK